MWMTPFYLFAGVLLVYIFHSQINLNKLKSFFSIFLILFIFSPLAYSYVSITQTDKRTDYQGKKIAIETQELWNKNRNERIMWIIGGDEWVAGNLSYHLKDRPKWKLNFDNKDILPESVYLCGEVYGSCLNIND